MWTHRSLQLSLHLKLPMALHQPKYVVLLGSEQVRGAALTARIAKLLVLFMYSPADVLWLTECN